MTLVATSTTSSSIPTVGMSHGAVMQRRRGPLGMDQQQPQPHTESGDETEDRIRPSSTLLASSQPPSFAPYQSGEHSHSTPILNAHSASTDALTLMEEVLLLGLKDQQGYMSFLNDSISYVLRGCLLIELSFRGKIRSIRETPRRHPADRYLEVVDSSLTGEVLLDEALKLMKLERHSLATWIDLLSGETWNPMKIGYQLRQVRERLAKGLVDKGILRTEKKSFVLFDMATHPLSDAAIKAEIIARILNALLGRGSAPDLPTIALIASATAANVLDNSLLQLSYGQREAAHQKAEAWMKEYSKEETSNNDILAGVLTVYSRMDSLLY